MGLLEPSLNPCQIAREAREPIDYLYPVSLQVADSQHSSSLQNCNCPFLLTPSIRPRFLPDPRAEKESTTSTLS